MEDYKKILQFVDDQARITVGVLCKRVEVLEEGKVLSPNLYKSLAKEIIYEHSRNLKKLIEVYLTVGTVVFKPKNSEKE